MKRLVIISDMHAGALTGLTPPKWSTEDKHKKCWDEYTKILLSLQPIDILVVNGDAINGSGRDGGIDTLVTDHNDQCEMASEIIDLAQAKKVIITAGTDSHTGKDGEAVEYERHIIDKLKVKALNRNSKYDNVIYDYVYDLKVENVRFNFRHFTGSRSNYAARSGTGGMDAAWDVIRSALGDKEKADIIVRSHVHYFMQWDNAEQFVVITPSLQVPEAKYALKKCNGIVHWGLCYFDIDNGKYSFDKVLRKFSESKISEYNM